MYFKSFNLKPELIEVLQKLGYEHLTKVQEIVIPKALKGENIIAKSETGSGKTHSFLVPIINNIEVSGKIQAIIVSPTKELAKQTYDFAMQILNCDFYQKVKCKLFSGGEDSQKDVKSFASGADIIIATPGKLNFLLGLESLDLSCLKTIVLDEADMLIDSSFIQDIDKIFSKIDKRNIQIEVFSATISNNVKDFLRKYISPDYLLTATEDNKAAKSVTHFFINTKHQDKFKLLLSFIKLKNPYLLFIFGNSKTEAKKIYEFLSENKFKCGFISGELEKRERKSMLRRIKNDEFRIVVCTDLAARGIDVEDVSDVLNFNIPNNLEYYYHRAGRTGRLGKSGNCYSFYDNDTLNLPLKLLREGLSVQYLKFVNDELVEDIPLDKKSKLRRSNKTNDDLEREIKKAKHQAMGKTVKPGYKKKVKNAIDKVKRKHRREVIRKDIRRQRVERYKREAMKE